MIKVHVAADGTKSFQVCERARVREKSIKVYVGSFASRREAEFAAQQHRVTQRGIKAGEFPAAVDHKRTMAMRSTRGSRRSRTSARMTSTRAACASTSARRLIARRS